MTCAAIRTRLPCHGLRSNAMRLRLHVQAYNVESFRPTPVLPDADVGRFAVPRAFCVGASRGKSDGGLSAMTHESP